MYYVSRKVCLCLVLFNAVSTYINNENTWYQGTQSCVSGQERYVAHKCDIYRNR